IPCELCNNEITIIKRATKINGFTSRFKLSISNASKSKTNFESKSKSEPESEQVTISVPIIIQLVEQAKKNATNDNVLVTRLTMEEKKKVKSTLKD
ncbi:MAG: hypothetical protein OXE99_02125, partial [Cellvibrionales bacterium]|nr:hypothetical protein [Cellvibrionales bacterium]